MSYIGKTPTVGNFQVCDAISVVNNQAAYTMQVGSVNVSPESANHMIVSLNGVIQKPTDAFTVSGSTITFASNLVTGDVINFIQILGNVLDLGVPSDSTVSLAKLTATGTKNSTTFLRGDNTFNAPPLGGITEFDMYRLTAGISSNTDPIASNLERVDDATFSKIGTGVTNTSGVFSFPSTGLWQVGHIVQITPTTNDTVAFTQHTTANNGTAWDQVAQSNFKSGSGAVSSGKVTNWTLVNCTNVSNVKVKFAVGSIDSGSAIGASTDFNYTSFFFIRIGDSQ